MGQEVQTGQGQIRRLRIERLGREYVRLALSDARRPDGLEIGVDGLSLWVGGKRWVGVMGEIHFSRVPREAWREALLAMKAGGVDIVASYVFWIHHEEEQGEYDWTGRRNLREFVECAGEVGLWVLVRCGPWCHGEVRNGGFPDWLVRSGLKLRSDDAGYLEHVRRWYEEVGRQLKGLLWKDGGPVIGVQLENEYGGPGEHLLRLKRLAQEAGLCVPIYTRTGWPALSSPLPMGEILPMYGGYAEGFWDRSLEAMPGEYWRNFCFSPGRVDTAIGTDQLRYAEEGVGEERVYPYLTCEVGGGMISSYHRRIRIEPEDVLAVAMTRVGSGCNLLGYYMYRGGINPVGRSGNSLNETQASGYWNDLPERNYDFQAPIGAFGQLRPHYHLLRRLHLFLRDWREAVAGMEAYFPEEGAKDKKDGQSLRWAVRSDGRRGLVFVNNWQRGLEMGPKEGVQFEVEMGGQVIKVPGEPVTVPAGATFFWPVCWDLAGDGSAELVYATAELVCWVEEEGVRYVVMRKIEGIACELVVRAEGGRVISGTGLIERGKGQIRVRGIEAGTRACLSLRTRTGRVVRVVVVGWMGNAEEGEKGRDLSREVWKGRCMGRERVVLSAGQVIFDGEKVILKGEGAEELSLAMLPAPRAILMNGRLVRAKRDGVFGRFDCPRDAVERLSRGMGEVRLELIQEAAEPRLIPIGSAGVAEAPTEAEFERAAQWRIRLPTKVDLSGDAVLVVDYVGDVARVYVEDQLIWDDFYNGRAMEVGLSELSGRGAGRELVLKVLPLAQGAPIYLGGHPWPEFGDRQWVAEVRGVRVVSRQRVECTAVEEG